MQGFLSLNCLQQQRHFALTYCTVHLHTAKPHSSDLKTQFNRCSLPVYCSFDSAERQPCASLGLCWTGSLPTIGLYNTNLK